MEDAENAFNDAITKMQEALEMVREEGGGAFDLKNEIAELEAHEGELLTAGEEINEEFKELCRAYVAMEEDMNSYNELKDNLQGAADALGLENCSLREIREAIQEKCEELGTENQNLKSMLEAHGEIEEECDILRTEIDSHNDVCSSIQSDLEKIQEENGRMLKKYKKYKKKLRKLEQLAGILGSDSDCSD